MLSKLTTRVNLLAQRIGEEFRTLYAKVSAQETAIRDLPKRVSDIQTGYKLNLWSLDPEVCYVNKEYTVTCTLVDKTIDHVKFSFQAGAWRGYYDLVLDNLLTSPSNSLLPNTDYTITFEIFADGYTNSGLRIGSIFVRLYDNSNIEGTLQQIEVLNGWTRYKFSFRTTDQPITRSSFGFFIQQASFYGENPGELHLRKLQLQEGTVPTTFEKNFNRDLTKAVVDTSGFALKTEVQEVKTLAETKLGDNNQSLVSATPSYISNIREPVRFGWYNSSTVNRPTSSGGNVAAFSSKGHFRKEQDNWINQLVFDVDGRVLTNRSINGGEFGSWIELVTSISTSANIRGAGALVGNNITSRSVTGLGYWKRWCKFSSTASPKGGQTGTYTHPLTRNKIISVSIRVDGTTQSTSQGFEVVITDTAFLVTNKNPDVAFESRPITFYVEYEP